MIPYPLHHISPTYINTIFLLLALSIPILSSLYLAPRTINFLRNIGLVGKDMNKKEKNMVAEGGGLIVFLSFTISFLSFILLSIVFSSLCSYPLATKESSIFVLKAFAIYSSMSLIFLIGFLEDLYNIPAHHMKMWKEKEIQKKKGFSQKYKFVLPIIASLPIVILSLIHNYNTFYIPFINKEIYLGVLYPLLLVPIGIIGASNALNLLAGLNGLEASLASITYITLAIFTYFKLHDLLLTFFALLFAIVSLTFLLFNFYPSRVFPGDSYTYMAGNGIAIIAILSRAEYFALSIFALWFLELFLKIRSKMKAESFGRVNKKGKLERPYPKIYSITHIFMNGKRGEKEIVKIIISIQIAICMVALLIFL